MERFRGRLARTTAQRLARNWAILHEVSGTNRAEPPARELARGLGYHLLGAPFFGPITHALVDGTRPTGRDGALAALGVAVVVLIGVWRRRRSH